MHLDLPVSYLDALLGAEIKVPTFDGDVHLKLPANTKTNSVFFNYLEAMGFKGSIY
ncbi:DnaJ C-terminal domain-containing protein [Spiroplasma poulsonii]|uniref:DnaJ C-terminal domain-containing protein n=1 Tax=Spiroplasma poulsonii TaxID=2138 RepID=UPI001F4D1264|nr:DnaJ C-terminal domain-containing protein [Spiroplasma poulsonii]UNF62065.1 hypothetical protein MNU24_00950 [Spiroplasma poulsonii]